MTNQSRDIIAALAFGLLDDLRATSNAQDRMLENALRENERLEAEASEEGRDSTTRREVGQ